MEFQLPENVRSSEELGLHIEFQEVRTRGSDTMFCQVYVTEYGMHGFEVHDTYTFDSWEEMKEQYPTLMGFLVELACNENWDSAWRSYDRIYFIEKMEGNEGLYDLNETVWFDAQERFGDQDEEELC